MAKLIVTGATREQALTRGRRALREFRIEGVASVLPFHRAVIENADFMGTHGFNVHTRWIESDFAERLAAAVRAEPQPDSGLLRTAIEIDGRRVILGLPAKLVGGLANAQAPSPATAPAPAAEANARDVPAPVAGTVQAWKVADATRSRKVTSSPSWKR